MRKVEYVYLHGLLYEIRTYLEETTTASPDAFAEYDSQPTRPAHVFKQKEKHEEAIKLLSTELAEEMADGAETKQLIEN